MAKDKSPESMRTSLRDWSIKTGERYLDLLNVNRKEYAKVLKEGSLAAEDLSRRYSSSQEQDGSELAAHHQKRLDRLRSRPRGDYEMPGRDGDFPWPDRVPDRPPDDRPFDERPEFPSPLDFVCRYSPVVTLDTAPIHTHNSIGGGVATPASFTDDLSAGVNLCQPFAGITSVSSASLADPIQIGFTSGFRFNFTPPTTDTYRFKPAAFVNGFAYTLEVGGILAGAFVGPTWSTSVRLTFRVTQLASAFTRSIDRPILDVAQGDPHSNVISYDATSDSGAVIEAELDGNIRAHVVVGLRGVLTSVNSFPSVRFDGLEQYFKVPEVYVDRLICRRVGTRLVIP